MKIVSCPKGGRIPEGYCKKSCLNYPHVPKRNNEINIKNHGKILVVK